jgi:AraC family transcriptional regulator of adaptative response/methylated-DNA-[protein]-cysteine methyltransferase
MGELSMTDYERIAHAINFIRCHISEQPSLAEVAAQVHLSEYHFQRLFCRWAGVTPKRYLQLLTLERAKRLLRERNHSVLNASYEVGLSSSSRLYDHFVQIEAVTPSEYQQKGQGVTILFGYHETPYGLAFVAQTPQGICQFDFVDPTTKEAPLNHLRQSWCNANIIEDTSQTARVIELLFSRQPIDTKPLSLWVRGTNFQLNVWRALLNIPLGEIASYSDIAYAIGNPRACRAVGTAIGSNPVGLIIPCHRVLRQTGELGGYRWGEIRKHAILAREAAHSEHSHEIEKNST